MQSRSSDPNSGNVDTDTVAGVQQADKVGEPAPDVVLNHLMSMSPATNSVFWRHCQQRLWLPMMFLSCCLPLIRRHSARALLAMPLPAAGDSFVGAQLTYAVLASIPDSFRRILVQRTPAGRMPKSDSNTEISFGEAAANLESQPLKKGANASQAVRPAPRYCIGSYCCEHMPALDA